MRRSNLVTALLSVFTGMCAYSQQALVNTTGSPFAKQHPVGIGDVQWTKGFWAERFAVCKDSMVPVLWKTYTSKEMCYAFQNFRVAAGIDTGRFRGPSFHDGDFYKTLEAVAALYAATKDRKLDLIMDDAIKVIAQAQQPDGYIYTKSIIEQRKTGQTKMFDDKLSFEAYNFGHLMTAACVHYRATGKRNLLDIAIRATDFLIGFYNTATPEQARNAICPSHYMGIAEIYRTTRDPKYLALLNKLIDIRGTSEGSDDNSDRLPFRKMTEVNGHAVRANYLFAGVADLYAETGDASLLHTLDLMWDDVVHQKLYVTGGCGALYDGLSLEGISYKPDSIQKIQQAYGKDYQLPNKTAHNETCANIGNVLWNWRMFLLTGESKYIDILERSLYNSVLSGISLQGTSFFYTNPLASAANYPYELRWSGGRSRYISKSNCCPPNIVRTIAEVSEYMYSIGEHGLFVNLYDGNKLSTHTTDGRAISLEQSSSYPWNGDVTIVINELPADLSVFLRIPGWCRKATVKLNGKLLTPGTVNGFMELKSNWKRGDKIELALSMPATLIESNPLVEESRNQVTVKKGPLVYCLESTDQAGANVFDIILSPTAVFKPLKTSIGSSGIIALETNARLLQQPKWNSLYRELNTASKNITARLIPYYAWANRGKSDMTVWIPVR